MKRVIIGLLVCIFAWSCNESNEDEPQVRRNDNAKRIERTGIRTIEEVTDVVNEGIKRYYSNPSRNGAVRTFSKEDVFCNVVDGSRSNEGDTLYYVVNFHDNMGFAIVSANRGIEGLLAIAETGKIYKGENQDNPCLTAFLNGLSKYLYVTNQEIVVQPAAIGDTITPVINPDLAQYKYVSKAI